MALRASQFASDARPTSPSGALEPQQQATPTHRPALCCCQAWCALLTPVHYRPPYLVSGSLGWRRFTWGVHRHTHGMMRWTMPPSPSSAHHLKRQFSDPFSPSACRYPTCQTTVSHAPITQGPALHTTEKKKTGNVTLPARRDLPHPMPSYYRHFIPFPAIGEGRAHLTEGRHHASCRFGVIGSVVYHVMKVDCFLSLVTHCLLWLYVGT